MKLLLIALLASVACQKQIDPEGDSIRLNYLSRSEAAQVLGREDQHARSLSRFSMEALLGRKDATAADYLAFAAEQALDWDAGQQKTVEQCVNELNRTIRRKGLKLPFPESINIISSTLAEEGGAGGYTRGTTVVLSRDLLEQAPVSVIKTVVAHEVFHVLTRNDPDFRRKMYALIGFEVLPRSVELPDGLKDYVIDNPDVNAHDHCAVFTIGGKRRNCMLLLYSKTDYTGGYYWDYFSAGLLEIDPQSYLPVLEDGQYRLYSIDDAADFYDQVGDNTEYTIDPEEILADNFSYLLTTGTQGLPSPELIVRMEKVCRGLAE